MWRPWIARLLCLAAASMLLAAARPATADPFADASKDGAAYQALQTLAAHNLIDGVDERSFLGDRPLTRNEMAVYVARAIAKIQAQGASKADLETVQKLINDLKDELDGLGVRVANIEDSIAAYDQRTHAAQALTFHADLRPNLSYRQRLRSPQNIAFGPADPFVTTFLVTDARNNFFDPAGSGLQLRYNDRFTIGYAVNDNLSLEFPVHLLNFNYGGAFAQQTHADISPGVEVHVRKAGLWSNLSFKFGLIDGMRSSLTGLTFRAPDNANNPPYGDPLQPFQRGVALAGTFKALTDVFVAVTRVDQTYLYSQDGTNVLDPSGYGTNTILFPVTAPQGGYLQTNPAGAPTVETFTARGGSLGSIFLAKKAVAGSVYISYLQAPGTPGTFFTPSGAALSGSGTAPAFVYNDAYNNVTFGAPLAPGTVVQVSYNGLTATNNTNWQRYMVNSRITTRLRNAPGTQFGITINRIFDFADPLRNPGPGPVALAANAQGAPFGAISNSVFGLDFQTPIFSRAANLGATLFAEYATSRSSGSGFSVQPVGDAATVAGLRFKLGVTNAGLQYQVVGPGYLDGAPFHYFGNAPALFSYYNRPYFPGFFGIANNVAVNRAFDASYGSAVAKNPALTYAYPIFNPFEGFGPNFYQAYTPNSQGPTLSLSTPFRALGTTLSAHLTVQRLREIVPESFATMQYCSALAPSPCTQYQTAVKQTKDMLSGGLGFKGRIFGIRNVGFDLSAGYERLRRDDRTPVPYIPFNPNLQTLDPGAAALVEASGGTSRVSFYPNYNNVARVTYDASVAVPVSKDVVLNLQANSQHYFGSYGTTLGQNIDARKNYYYGNLTYTIPKTQSSIQFVARQYRYLDSNVPSYNLTQNRQDINFSVRF